MPPAKAGLSIKSMSLMRSLGMSGNTSNANLSFRDDASARRCPKAVKSFQKCLRGPNGLKLEKETSYDLLSWKRRASMA